MYTQSCMEDGEYPLFRNIQTTERIPTFHKKGKFTYPVDGGGRKPTYSVYGRENPHIQYMQVKTHIFSIGKRKPTISVQGRE